MTQQPSGRPAESPAAAGPGSNGGRPGRPAQRRWSRTVTVIATLTALGAAGGAAFALTATAEYQSRAYVLVSGPPAVADNGTAVGLAHAYARVALEQAVVGRALAARGLPSSGEQFTASLSVATSPDAPIIEIVGHGDTAARAMVLADVASRAFVSYLGKVGRPTGYLLTLLSPAASAEVPGSPGLPLSIAVGAAAGGVLATGWRLLRT